jgi:sec-independent protein translocase protein TatA
LLISLYLCTLNFRQMNALAIFLGVVGVPQIILIAVIVLLLFGGKKIPELMKGIGNGIKEFKNAAKDDQPANSKKEEETKEKE